MNKKTKTAADLRELIQTQEHRPLMTELYRRAQTQLRRERRQQQPKVGKSPPVAGPGRLVHELQVHQVELEMQNAELRQTRDDLEAALENYTDLYDFAPVGYFSLAASGAINRVNLTGASLVGLERARLVGRPFGQWVAAEQRADFNSFLKKVFASQTKQFMDVELLRPEQPPLIVNIAAQRLINPLECRAAVQDITARKFAETASTQLAAIVNSSSDAIIGKDLNGIITSWNGGAKKLFGFSASEMIGQPVLRLIPPERRHEETQILSRIRQGQSIEHFETVRVTQAGWRRDVSVTVSPIRNAAGKIIGASKVARDITVRKEQEAMVRVSEIRHRRLFETAQDGILLLDPDTRKITDANPFMTKLLGYSHDQLVGKELFEIGLLKDEAASQKMFQRLKRKHEVRYEDLPLESRKGRHQEVEVVANLYQENGHAVIQCNIRDITARKQAEDALRASEGRFRAAVAIVSSLIWTNNTEGLMEGEQPGWGNFTGQTQNAYQGYGWVKAVHPEDAQPTLIAWKRAVANKSLFEFEHRVRRRDGEWRFCSIHALPLLGADGKIREWVGVHTDITERKRAEETQRRLEVLAASNRKLEQEIVRRQTVEQSLKQSEQHQIRLLTQSRLLQAQMQRLSRQILTAQEEERKRISRELHDVIAQTLTGINIRLATLKKEAAVNARGLESKIARTQRQVEKSVDIVHRFARELRPTVLDDLGLIPALHAFMKDFNTRTGVRTHLTAFAGVEQMDIVKRTALYRVAQEALVNVARHAHASRVEVSIQKLADGVSLKIKDDGKSFETERVLQGKGGKRLGLLGMRERVEMVGGTFGIESARGQGTTIIARLPLAAAGGGGVR